MSYINGWHKITNGKGNSIIRFIEKGRVEMDPLTYYDLNRDCLIEEVVVLSRKQYEELISKSVLEETPA